MNKILLLTDFSKVSNYAQQEAIKLAIEHNASLTFYHVLEENARWMYELDSESELYIYKGDNGQYEVSLKELKEQLLKKKIKSNIVIGSSNLIQNFEEICLEYQPDLVVIGAKGMGESVSYIGSKAKEVIASAKIPVLVIKGPMKDKRIDEVVFASKYDETDREKFKKSLRLLSLPNDATIYLMSVDTSSYFLQPTALMKDVMKDFEALAFPIKATSTFYKDYDVEKGIQHFLEKVDPDLLVMAYSERNIIKQIFQSDAALESAVSSPYPVLIIH